MSDPTPNILTLPKLSMEKIVLGLLPFTPVPFSGSDSLLAFGRIAGYSAIAYFTFTKMKNISYGFMGAAALSLATSLSAGLWKKQSPVSQPAYVSDAPVGNGVIA
jgi:hypothetical protein